MRGFLDAGSGDEFQGDPVTGAQLSSQFDLPVTALSNGPFEAVITFNDHSIDVFDWLLGGGGGASSTCIFARVYCNWRTGN